MVLLCFEKLLVGFTRDESSASALIKPAVSPAMGTSQFRSWIRTLNGLVQMSFWSRPKLRRNFTGLALAYCDSSLACAGGAGVGVGAGIGVGLETAAAPSS